MPFLPIKSSDEIVEVRNWIQILSTAMTMLHSINAHEVSALSLISAQLDKYVDSFNTLLQGQLPLHLIPTSRLQMIIANISTYLATHHPSFQVLYPTASAYYQFNAITYARTQNNLFVTLNIPVSASNLLFHIYKIDNIPYVSGQNNDSMTYITGLPKYLGVSDTSTFYTEIDETTFQSCKGFAFKTCESTLHIREMTDGSCASSLFLGNIDKIYDLCKISLDPEPNPKDAYFIDLQDDRVLITTTQDTKWIRACERQPAHFVEPCGTCILSCSCSCSLKSNNFYLAPSITQCVTPNLSLKQPVPNFMAIFSYYRSLQSERQFFNNESILADQTFLLPAFNITKVIIGNNITLPNQDKPAFDLKKALQTINTGGKLFGSPLDFYLSKTLDPLEPPHLITTVWETLSTYVTPVMISIQFLLIIKLYRTQAQLTQTYAQRSAEILTLANLLPTTDAFHFPHVINDNQIANGALIFALTFLGILLLSLCIRCILLAL